MNFISGILSESFISALGWTLAHSFWQGLLLVVLLSFLLRKLQQAKWRYTAAYLAMLSLFAASCLTFMFYYQQYGLEEQGAQLMITVEPEIAAGSYSDIEEVGVVWESRLDVFYTFIEDHKNSLVFAWFLGFALFFIQLLGGLWQIHLMRQTGLADFPVFWRNRLDLLLEKADCTKKIQLFYSSKVHTPLTLGHFKPLILFPIGLVNQLTEEQVELVLAHELAHILRNDFGLNLFQSILEALYYYHPAVWFLGNVIRTEREHCCDDFAMDLCENPLVYAKTLVEIETIQSKQRSQPTLALAIKGTKKKNRNSDLLNRIQRILNQPQQKNTQIMEKFAATALLLLCLTFWTVQAKTDLTESFENFNVETLAFDEIQGDTIKPKIVEKRIEKFKKDDGDESIEITTTNGEVSEILVNGETIPSERYGEFSDTIDEMKTMQEEGGERKIKKRIIMVDADEDVFDVEEPASPDAPDAPRKMRKEVRVESVSDGEGNVVTTTDEDGNTMIFIENEGNRTEIKVVDGKVFMNGKEVVDGESMGENGGKRMIFINEDGEKTVMDSDEEMEWESEDSEGRQEKMRIRMEKAKEGAEEQIRRIEVRIEEMEDDIERRIDERKERQRSERRENLEFHEHSGGSIGEVRTILVEEKIIGADEPFDIVLTSKKLKVNGKKQPSDVHARMVKLLNVGKDDTFEFHDERK